MENIPNTNNPDISTPANAPVKDAGSQQIPDNAQKAEFAAQGFNPTYTPPVYNNQYNPVAPYATGSYTAPSYTPQQSVPYNSQPAFNIPYNPARYNQSPSAIYNNTPHGNAPQYHYGDPSFNVNFNNAYYQEHQQKLAEKKAAERQIRNAGNISGALLLACLFVATIFSTVLVIPSVYELFNTNLTVSSFINMLYSIIVVGGTFLVFGRFYRKKADYNNLNPTPDKNFKISYSAPKDKLQAVLLIFISFGGCMLANYISSFILSVLSVFGIESTYSSIQDPKGIIDTILMCVSVAVIPPLIEEYALRGVALSGLRRYGNAFAIIASSIMFGIFHGEALQIPFALMCGFFFAYSVIATESLWVGIIILAMNNILSCMYTDILQVTDETVANTFFVVVSVAGIILGVLCLFIYYFRFKNDGVMSYKGEANILTTGQKVAKFLTSPVMIVAIIVYGIQALTTLNFS